MYKYLTSLFLLMSFSTGIIAEEDVTTVSATKKMKYEVSLNYTLWAGKEWWSKIEPYNLYLGGLPLKNKGHLEQIKALGVTGIISVVEGFELEDGWWHQPAKPSDWQREGIAVKHIPAVDFLPLTRQEFKEGLEALHEMLTHEEIVYLHCKAGVGRSASIAVAYIMQQQNLSLEDAIAYVKKYRPHINLNEAQKRAIADYFKPDNGDSEENIKVEDSYFTQAQAMTEESLTKMLSDMQYYVIEGGNLESNQYPDFMSGWAPGVKIESTMARRNRYLKQFNGDQDAAVKAAVKKNHSIAVRWKNTLAGFIPFVGAPANYTMTLWNQMREVALIAAIYGHQFDDTVKMQILEALVQGNAMKVPAQTVDMVAKRIIKSIILQAGLKNIPGMSLPSHLLFNYFTDNSAKVSTYAIETFGGEHARPVDPKEYWDQE